MTRTLDLIRTARRIARKGHKPSIVKAIWIAHANPHMSTLWCAKRSESARWHLKLWAD